MCTYFQSRSIYSKDMNRFSVSHSLENGNQRGTSDRCHLRCIARSPCIVQHQSWRTEENTSRVLPETALRCCCENHPYSQTKTVPLLCRIVIKGVSMRIRPQLLNFMLRWFRIFCHDRVCSFQEKEWFVDSVNIFKFNDPVFLMFWGIKWASEKFASSERRCDNHKNTLSSRLLGFISQRRMYFSATIAKYV